MGIESWLFGVVGGVGFTLGLALGLGQGPGDGGGGEVVGFPGPDEGGAEGVAEGGGG